MHQEQKNAISYYAHSAPDADQALWQVLSEHLIQVGELAAARAAFFNYDATGLARVAGRLHDLGKYCPEFQDRLKGNPLRVDHATWGAKIVKARYPAGFGDLLAYAIAGHHAGLADGKDNGVCKGKPITDLHRRLTTPLKTTLDEVWKQQIELPEQLKTTGLGINQRLGSNYPYFQYSVLVRMLFSCLVDSDFIDTETYYRSLEGRSGRENSNVSLSQLQSRLSNYLSQPKFQQTDGIGLIRAKILSHVRAGADLAPGLFTLNVPTGGGKTLASLAFALDHAVKHGLRRVIMVIPYTSIVEQNAKVWREALGDADGNIVLEHHSGFDADSMDRKTKQNSATKLKLAQENWEAPIVVTTSVQFFESLHANRTSQCRKLHNIAASVVILDEAQTLPLSLLKPCVAMIRELSANYSASVVLCTATQPALLSYSDGNGFDGGLSADEVRELAPNPISLHQELTRVTVRYVGQLSDEKLASELLGNHSALCIVNSRKHARSVFERIEGHEGTYHLSTLMCAEHRSKILEEVRARLDAGEPVRLISTSLIEAGVDVDFAQVYRATAGLDSVAQAAGRCNREGRRGAAQSWVTVFDSDPALKIPPELDQLATAFRSTYKKHTQNPLGPKAIESYFDEVYWIKDKGLDAHNLMDKYKGPDDLSFNEVASLFKMIDSTMLPLIVPFDERAREAIDELVKQLSFADSVGGAARRLQRYLVQVPAYTLKQLMDRGQVSALCPERYGQQFLLLEWSGSFKTSNDLYNASYGLVLEDSLAQGQWSI